MHIIFFLLSCDKSKSTQPAAPPATSSAAPCNATNLVVDSIKEINSQSKIYQLTVKDYTLTSPSGQTVSTVGVYQVTMTVLGDTVVNGYQGKRYRIKNSQGWDFKAYSYKNSTDSLWHMIPFYNNSGGEDFFNVVMKLPLSSGLSYTYSNVYTCSVSPPICKQINYVNQAVYTVNDVNVANSPTYYFNTIYVNKTGLMAWSYYVLYLQTQNPENHATEWYFEKIN